MPKRQKNNVHKAALPATTENADATSPSNTPELPGVGTTDALNVAYTLSAITLSIKLIPPPSSSPENISIIKYGNA